MKNKKNGKLTVVYSASTIRQPQMSSRINGSFWEAYLKIDSIGKTQRTDMGIGIKGFENALFGIIIEGEKNKEEKDRKKGIEIALEIFLEEAKKELSPEDIDQIMEKISNKLISTERPPLNALAFSIEREEYETLDGEKEYRYILETSRSGLYAMFLGTEYSEMLLNRKDIFEDGKFRLKPNLRLGDRKRTRRGESIELGNRFRILVADPGAYIYFFSEIERRYETTPREILGLISTSSKIRGGMVLGEVKKIIEEGRGQVPAVTPEGLSYLCLYIEEKKEGGQREKEREEETKIIPFPVDKRRR